MINSNGIDKKGLSQNEQSEENFEQWHRFIADHGFTWKGILSRYDGEGKITEVLDSTRKFTCASDASQIEHYLHFVNSEDSSKAIEKQWIIEKCGPGIIHPVDPESTIMFSSQGSGIMSRPGREYAEIYLIKDNFRISTVISYNPKNECVLARISLFREAKQDESSFPWSKEKPEITNREYPNIKVINSSILQFGSFDEISLSNDIAVDWIEENRLIFNFPDGISLNVPKTLEPSDETNIILSWKYSDNRVKRAIAQFSSDAPGANLITQECTII